MRIKSVVFLCVFGGWAWLLGAGCGLFQKPDCVNDADCFSADYMCASGRCILRTGKEGGSVEKGTVEGGSDGGTGACETGQRRACYTGPSENRGVGVCLMGEQLCLRGVWGECVGQILPGQEICGNGYDDDCNGLVDDGCGVCKAGETRACYNGPQGTRYKGTCKDGVQTCRSDKTWGNCVGEVLPKEERCDGEDNDCNGQIDDSCFECRQGEQQNCYPSNTSGCEKIGGNAYSCKGTCKVGTQFCQANGRWGECSGFIKPGLELCNGLDDNCDGQVDNGISGPACPKQSGVCAGSGQPCGGTKGWLPCDDATYVRHSVDYQTGTELGCDGKDNNCNGLVDENCSACKPGATQPCYGGPPGTDKVAPCKAGVSTCQSNGTWGACAGQVLPQTEVCDGKDNDCDGLKDETFPNMGRFCTTTKPGICSRGAYICKNGVETCEPLEQPRTQEFCNGTDDDCDGKIDEGAAAFTYYADTDGDGYGDPAKTIKACSKPAGYVTNNQDCYDKNKDVFPGQTGFFSVHRGDGSFDYNCDNVQQKRYTQVGSCKGCTTPIFDQGFVNGIPDCGKNGDWVDACRFDIGKCSALTIPKPQECR
ncbi:MAG: hypothetical protein H6728_13590 [Myxococcales bacterium]|nr:hypothetical protein [Myxococcales bacterium]MCB9644103.1 hypothetical protein [Myxococcales bacterium]